MFNHRKGGQDAAAVASALAALLALVLLAGDMASRRRPAPTHEIESFQLAAAERGAWQKVVVAYGQLHALQGRVKIQSSVIVKKLLCGLWRPRECRPFACGHSTKFNWTACAPHRRIISGASCEDSSDAPLERNKVDAEDADSDVAVRLKF